jgi:hypothetical protein
VLVAFYALSTDLSITYINSTVTAYGIFLGSIAQPVTFPAKGKTTTTSPQLDFTINLDPPSILTVLRALAVDGNLGTSQIDGILALGGYQYLPIVNTTATEKPAAAKRDSLDKRANIYTSVFTSFHGMAVCLILSASVADSTCHPSSTLRSSFSKRILLSHHLYPSASTRPFCPIRRNKYQYRRIAH